MTVEFNDPGADSPWKVTVDWDVSAVGSLDTFDSATKSFTLSHAYPDNGVFTARVTVDDGDGGTCEATFTVAVAHQAPVVDAGLDAVIDEGGLFLSQATFDDAGKTDAPWRVTVGYGDAPAVYTDYFVIEPIDLAHQYLDDPAGPDDRYTAAVSVKDKDGAETTDTATVTVNNVAPTWKDGSVRRGRSRRKAWPLSQ